MKRKRAVNSGGTTASDGSRGFGCRSAERTRRPGPRRRGLTAARDRSASWRPSSSLRRKRAPEVRTERRPDQIEQEQRCPTATEWLSAGPYRLRISLLIGRNAWFASHANDQPPFPMTG